MEAASWFSVASVVFLAIGVAVGAAAGHFFSPAIGEAKRLRSDLERLQREHESYRSSVNSHFRKTADLVGQMTKSYAAVYDHLAGGARRFCDDSGADAMVSFEPLPGALASPVIETAADAAGDGAAVRGAEEVAAREPEAGATAGGPAVRDTLEEATAEGAPAGDLDELDLAPADDAAPGYATNEYASNEYASDGYASDGYAAEEYAADQYAVANDDGTVDETDEARSRT
jgi:uncharacterized membrane-anchored protein YhcB (DUF1043 family)